MKLPEAQALNPATAHQLVRKTSPSARAAALQELETLDAEKLWSDIEDLPSDVQQKRIRQATHFTTQALFEVLEMASRRVGRKNRASGVQIAKLALTAALTLESPDPDTGKSTLWARAWTLLGNSRRLAFELKEAEVAFTQAEHFLPLDAGPVLRGEMALTKAALRWYQQSYPDGLELVDHAISLLELTTAHTSLVKALLIRAIILRYLGKIKQGIESLDQVLGLLPTLGNPIHLGVTAHYTLARYHREVGDYGKVQEVLTHLRDWTGRYELSAYDMYINWFEGRVALDLEDPAQAERQLVAAQAGFSDIGSRDYARMVGLDLAIAYATQGKNDLARETLRETIEAFEMWRHDHPRMERAWRKLKRATIVRSIAVGDLLAVRKALDSFQEDPASSRYFDLSTLAV